MEKQNNHKKSQEFHFGDWESSSENDSQEIDDSDTICPISLNDLISIERKSQKQKQDDDTDFVIPSLADSIENNNTHFQEESKNLFNTSVSKILYDFSQNATVLGFDSSFSNKNDDYQHEKKNRNTTQTINKDSNNDENDEKLKSFTSLVQNEQTFVKLHQKCFSSSSDSDIFVVTNNEEILEPDSDSSNENTFEDYQLSQAKQSKSQIYESNEKQKGNKSPDLIDIAKNKSTNQLIQRKSTQLKKSELKSQNLSSKINNEDDQTKIHKIESPKAKIKNDNNSIRESLDKSKTLIKNESSISSSKKSPNKSSNKSSRKQTSILLSSSSDSKSSSSSINFDLEDDIDDNNKNKKKQKNGKPTIHLANKKRHLNTLSEFNIDDYSYYSSYSYSDNEKSKVKKNSSSNLIDSLDSSITMKNTKQQKNQNKTQKQKQSDNNNQSLIDKSSLIKTSTHQSKNNKEIDKSPNSNKDKSKLDHSMSIKETDKSSDLNKDKSKLNQSINIEENGKSPSSNKDKSKLDHSMNIKETDKSPNLSQGKSKLDHSMNIKETDKSPNLSQGKSKLNHSMSIKETDKSSDLSQDKSKVSQSQNSSKSPKNKNQKTVDDSPNKILALHQLNNGDTIVYPKPKRKNSPRKQQQSTSSIDEDAPVDYPTIPPVILSPIQSKQKNQNENSTEIKRSKSSTEKRVSIELKDDDDNDNESGSGSNELYNIESGNESKDLFQIENDDHQSFNVSSSNEVAQNSQSEVNSSLKKLNKEKDSKILSSSNSGILKIGSFDKNKRKSYKLGQHSDDSYSYKSENDDDKWVDDDPENPSSEFYSESHRSKIEKEKEKNEKIQKHKKSEKTESDKIESDKNDKNKKHRKSEDKNHKKKSSSKSTSGSEGGEEEKKDSESIKSNETKQNSKKVIADIDNFNIPISSFYQFISEPSYCDKLNFISLVLTINGVFNLPPPSGVTNLDLVFHFPNIRCSPVVINLKSARFRAGKYEALDSQLLIRIPLLAPNSFPQSFYALNSNSNARIASIGDIFTSNSNSIKSENAKSGRNSRSNLEELNGIRSNTLVLSIELMGNGKRLCGTNLCLLESTDSLEKVEDKNEIVRKVEITSLAKHFLRLMQRPDLKCELKKGEKEPLVEIQISKVADNDEKQMSFLPFFSIIHVFFVDSVVSYRQILERYRIRKESDAIDQRDFDLLSFFAAASSDLASMKKFAKSFKDAMKKMPKDKRSDNDKLKLFVDMLRGSVVQGVTSSRYKKENQKGMLPFSTAQINTINQF